LVILATLATVIASQAIISGAFSMTLQAINLGWCPRLRIKQTSLQDHGQIYIGAVNWLLLIVTVGLTLSFGSSDHLAAAYGIAVSLTMMLTTILLFVTMREAWKWNFGLSAVIAGSLLSIDMAFFCANALKILDGGWVPLVLACTIYAVMLAWRRGLIFMTKAMHSLTVSRSDFRNRLVSQEAERIPGTAVFLSKAMGRSPRTIIWNMPDDRLFHQHIVALSIVVGHSPRIDSDNRLIIERLGPDFWHMIGHYGFMERPDIPKLLGQLKKSHAELDTTEIVYYVGHETGKHLEDHKGMSVWHKMLYAFLQAHSAQIHEYFNLQGHSVVVAGKETHERPMDKSE
jgi:KUP system potassium uptake protein